MSQIPELEPLTKQEKYTLNLKDIAKNIKQQLKTEFPTCSFSVQIQRYSMGQSLHVSLMSSDFKVIQDFDKISGMALFCYEHDHRCTKEQIQQTQREMYHQLNQYQFKGTYDPDNWNNGVFLTEQGFNLFRRVVEIIGHYNYDDSDSSIDYFDVNFYLHLNIGKWDRPYILKDRC